ncbi:hypothetical protein AVEN_197985-1 [Araneus ventricosus]|uniref:Uncharacterized protein n=1 Tax=Araneus ventricosus TaxID=182803 RepID=A0A4Y2IB34_ARAVE|nr:hypothetical protein AVEN_197985-1 [Araneus ventricosus]
MNIKICVIRRAIVLDKRFSFTFDFNPLTPKPAVTGHTTSILVGRISVVALQNGGEGSWVSGLKGPFWVEIGDERPAIRISHHPGEKMKRYGRIHFTDQLVKRPPYTTVLRF